MQNQIDLRQLVGTRTRQAFEEAYRNDTMSFRTLDSLTSDEAIKLLLHGAAYGADRETLKRKLSGILAAESIQPGNIVRMLDGMIANKRHLAEQASTKLNYELGYGQWTDMRMLGDPGPQLCSSKEELAQSLIYSLKLR